MNPGMSPVALLTQNKQEIPGRFGVERIGIFGSYVRGEEKPGSDVDILVEFREGEKTFHHYMDLKFYLEDLFGLRVDLVIKDAIKPRLREPILTEVIFIQGGSIMGQGNAAVFWENVLLLIQ